MASHAEAPSPVQPWRPLALACAAALSLLVISRQIPFEGYLALAAVVAVAGATALVVIAWHVDPAFLLTGSLVLASFNNHWDAFGLPASVAPDRFLLIAALAAAILRCPPARNRPAVPLRAEHALLALTLAWVVGSAIAAGTLSESDAYFGILDRFAVPFALFLLAPVVIRTHKHRQVLLAALVGFGAYLGLTALFETVGPRALVRPAFILDPAFGYHGARARGPFIEANANGMGLYACAVGAIIASVTWQRLAWRLTAGAVAVLCAAGTLFTLTRSVWLATLVATFGTLLAFRELRRFLLPAGAAALILVAVLFTAVPDLESRALARKDAARSVSERENVNAAALAMVSERPLVGFGWSTFNDKNDEYFPLLPDVPQTAERRLAIHNVFLNFATELGLIGATLFGVSFLAAIGGVIVTRGPPEMRPWRMGLLAIALCWSVVALFAPLGQVLPSFIPWLWAGVVIGGNLAGGHRRPALTL